MSLAGIGGRGPLIVAILLGSLTSFLVWRYVDGVGQAAKPAPTAPVVVMARSVPARTVLTSEMVQVQQIPVEARHPNAVASTREVVGKITRSALTAGEQMLTTRLFLQREESGLAFMIPDGMRAISVGFTEVIGTGGLVVPGDHVDIVGVFEVRRPAAPIAGGQIAPAPSPFPYLESGRDQETYFISTMVLQDIQVLAIAQRLEGEDTRDSQTRMAQSATSSATGTSASASSPVKAPVQPQAKTATLAVSPEDSLRVVLAEEKGKIRLALRPSNDTSVYAPNADTTRRGGSLVQVVAPARGEQ